MYCARNPSKVLCLLRYLVHLPNSIFLSLPTGVCMFILTYCIVCTLFTGLFTCQIKSVRLISIFVLIFMLLSLSAFVRFFIKETACLLACYSPRVVLVLPSASSQCLPTFRASWIAGSCFLAILYIHLYSPKTVAIIQL